MKRYQINVGAPQELNYARRAESAATVRVEVEATDFNRQRRAELCVQFQPENPAKRPTDDIPASQWGLGGGPNWTMARCNARGLSRPPKQQPGLVLVRGWRRRGQKRRESKTWCPLRHTRGMCRVSMNTPNFATSNCRLCRIPGASPPTQRNNRWWDPCPRRGLFSKPWSSWGQNARTGFIALAFIDLQTRSDLRRQIDSCIPSTQSTTGAPSRSDARLSQGATSYRGRFQRSRHGVTGTGRLLHPLAVRPIPRIVGGQDG
jgi:hypothetical protein